MNNTDGLYWVKLRDENPEPAGVIYVGGKMKVYVIGREDPVDNDDIVEIGERINRHGERQMIGWTCPRCGRVNSPFNLRCDCLPDTTWGDASSVQL